MRRPLLLLLLGLAPAIAGCGDATVTSLPAAGDAGPAPAQSTPPPALAPGTLSRIADGAEARRRIGYADLAAVRSFDGPLPAGELLSLVLGDGARRLGSAQGQAATTATQIGDTTILDGPERTVVGGSARARALVRATTPATSVITDETPSAMQSCLGNGVTETIVGPGVLGYRAALGVSLLDDDDRPAGPKLRICAAPHFYRELAQIERAFRARFPSAGLDDRRRPVIGSEDIGERDVARATIALDSVPLPLLRDLLGGGASLVTLSQR